MFLQGSPAQRGERGQKAPPELSPNDRFASPIPSPGSFYSTWPIVSPDIGCPLLHSVGEIELRTESTPNSEVLSTKVVERETAFIIKHEIRA